MQRRPATDFSRVSTAIIKLFTRHDPPSKLFSAHLQMRLAGCTSPAQHILPLPQRVLSPSPLIPEVF